MPTLHEKCSECKAMLTPRSPEIPESTLHRSFCSKFKAVEFPKQRECCATNTGQMHTPGCAVFRAQVAILQDPNPYPGKVYDIEAPPQVAYGGGMTAPQGSPHDPVNSPQHYTRHTIAAIDVIDSWGLDFELGSVLKYISRHEAKGGIEDLRKAAWYLARAIKNREAADGRGK